MKMRLLLLIVVFFSFSSISVIATENPTDIILEDTLSSLQTLQTSDFNFAETTRKITEGKLTITLESVLNTLLSAITEELKKNTSLLIKILVLSILTGILCNLQQAGLGGGIAEISFLSCFALIAGLSVSLMGNLTAIATETIDHLMLFIAGLMPVLGSLSLTTSVASPGFYPGLFTAMQVFVATCKNIFLPVITAATALSVVNSLSTRFHISRLIDFARQTVKWGLGLLLTIFVGILGLHGFTANAVGVAGRTAKYAISNFIPLVGGVLADSAETVLQSLRLIRGAIGIAGVFALLSLCIMPIIKILATSVLYRFAAGVAEPVTDRRIVKLLTDLAGNITLIFSIVLMVTVMFIITLAMLCALTV